MGAVTRRIGRNALLTTTKVRDDGDSYRAALAGFH